MDRLGSDSEEERVFAKRGKGGEESDTRRKRRVRKSECDQCETNRGKRIKGEEGKTRVTSSLREEGVSARGRG